MGRVKEDVEALGSTLPTKVRSVILGVEETAVGALLPFLDAPLRQRWLGTNRAIFFHVTAQPRPSPSSKVETANPLPFSHRNLSSESAIRARLLRPPCFLVTLLPSAYHKALPISAKSFRTIVPRKIQNILFVKRALRLAFISRAIHPLPRLTTPPHSPPPFVLQPHRFLCAPRQPWRRQGGVRHRMISYMLLLETQVF